MDEAAEAPRQGDGCEKPKPERHQNLRVSGPQWFIILSSLLFLLFPPRRICRLKKQHLGNTFGITMKTVALKIPEELDMKIRQAARRGKESFSALARRALIREIEIQETDFARLAAPYRGMFEGPADLSSREGYGDKNPR